MNRFIENDIDSSQFNIVMFTFAVWQSCVFQRPISQWISPASAPTRLKTFRRSAASTPATRSSPIAAEPDAGNGWECIRINTYIYTYMYIYIYKICI